MKTMSTWIRGAVALVAIPTIAVAVLWLVCACPCAEIEIARSVQIDADGRSVAFFQRGYRACIISPEGMFPSWAKSVRAKLSEGKKIDAHDKQTLRYGQDFVTQFDVGRDGQIEVVGDGETIILSLQYTGEYSWKASVNGRYRLSGSASK